MTTPTPGDLISTGQTLRAFAAAERPNAETAAILRRVGDWLVHFGARHTATVQSIDDLTTVEEAAITATILASFSQIVKLPRDQALRVLQAITAAMDAAGEIAAAEPEAVH